MLMWLNVSSSEIGCKPCYHLPAPKSVLFPSSEQLTKVLIDICVGNYTHTILYPGYTRCFHVCFIKPWYESLWSNQYKFDGIEIFFLSSRKAGETWGKKLATNDAWDCKQSHYWSIGLEYLPTRWFKPWPLLEVHQQPLKGSRFRHPKKGTKNHLVHLVEFYGKCIGKYTSAMDPREWNRDTLWFLKPRGWFFGWRICVECVQFYG